MKWISFNPGSDTTVKMSMFACLRVYSSDWKERECIFLRSYDKTKLRVTCLQLKEKKHWIGVGKFQKAADCIFVDDMSTVVFHLNYDE